MVPRPTAEHAVVCTATCNAYQSNAHRDLQQRIAAIDNEAFGDLDLGPRPEAADGASDDFSTPALSHYRFLDGRIIESRMFLFDTLAVRALLQHAVVKP